MSSQSLYFNPFNYDEEKKEYCFWKRDGNSTSSPVYFPLGFFLVQFLNTDIDTFHIKCVDYSNACNDFIFNLVYSNHFKYGCSCKLFDEWIFDLKRTLIDYIATNTINSEFEYFFLNRSSVRLTFNKYSDCNELYSDHLVDDLESLLTFECVKLRKNHINIKKCVNCGKYFIPTNRSDEIYCDNIFRSGKTCKQVGYEEKEKKDPFKSLYTKARKTQHARIRYNAKNKPNYKQEHYEPWKKSAEQARDYFKSKNDIDGFRKWIEDNKNSF